jgi:type IV pilus biogenesis protein CpaD/CtpE
MSTHEQATQEVRDALDAVCRGRVEAAVKAEREACAKVADDSDHVVNGRGYHDQLGDACATARNIAAAIRDRGQA